jgi:hypothetical protein
VGCPASRAVCGIVCLVIGTGELTCEQSSVTLEQIIVGYNIDFLELCQLLRRAELHGVAHFFI